MGDQPADTTSATTDATSDNDQQLNEGGLKALKAEREARQKAERKLAALESENLRRDVATSKGVPADLLTGSSKEELETQADRLLEFRGKSDDSGEGSSGQTQPMGRPKEKLRPGASPEPEGDDMSTVAKNIFNG